MKQKQTNNWNVRGADFSNCAPFETQYPFHNHISNKIARRAWTLGGFAMGSFEECLNYRQRTGSVTNTFEIKQVHGESRKRNFKR